MGDGLHATVGLDSAFVFDTGTDYSDPANRRLAGAEAAAADPTHGSNPLRIPPNDPMTCDQDHGYTHEQSAADHGAQDAYPASVGHSLTLTQCLSGFNFNGSPEVPPAAPAIPRPCSTTTTATR